MTPAVSSTGAPPETTGSGRSTPCSRIHVANVLSDPKIAVAVGLSDVVEDVVVTAETVVDAELLVAVEIALVALANELIRALGPVAAAV